MDYDQTTVASRYDKARSLSPGSACAALNLIDSVVGKTLPQLIVDVGCGTGRFTKLLLERFDASIVGLDPSRSMLHRARESIPESSAQFVRAAAEHLPFPDGTVHLAFISMAYHHFSDKAQAARELRRILNPEGRVCIRNAVADCLDTYLHLDYFPEARSHLAKVLPSRRDVAALMEASGFQVIVDELVELEFATSLEDLERKVRLRSQSELLSISDTAFSKGLERLSQARRNSDHQGPVRLSLAQFGFACV